MLYIFFICHVYHRDLHSFPTRRSSDLATAIAPPTTASATPSSPSPIAPTASMPRRTAPTTSTTHHWTATAAVRPSSTRTATATRTPTAAVTGHGGHRDPARSLRALWCAHTITAPTAIQNQPSVRKKPP